MIDYIKTFCNIPEAVKIYDKKIEQDKAKALARLRVAGVSQDEDNDLVKDYIATYCRLSLIENPSPQITTAENARLKDLLVLLSYGDF
ncbi:hypothetical protein [Lactococcus ileimucosae]|uniref:hypothetical protein n=1 Tax=Lactococcus ileimucosae TaxID=2941329 RepID=UPI00351742DE